MSLFLCDPVCLDVCGKVCMPLLSAAEIAVFFPGFFDLAGRVAPGTLREYRYDAGLYVAWCDHDCARVRDPASLRRWRHHMVTQTTLSPRTINRRLCAIKSLIRVSVAVDAVEAGLGYRFGLVERVQIAALKERVRRSTRLRLTREDVRLVCLSPDPTRLQGVRNRAFLAVLVGSGCRLSEAVSLRHEQLIPVAGGWQLELRGKGQSQPRRAPLSQEAYSWVLLWVQARAQAGVVSPWIFTAFAGAHRPLTRPLTPQGGYLLVQRCAQHTVPAAPRVTRSGAPAMENAWAASVSR